MTKAVRISPPGGSAPGADDLFLPSDCTLQIAVDGGAMRTFTLEELAKGDGTLPGGITYNVDEARRMLPTQKEEEMRALKTELDQLEEGEMLLLGDTDEGDRRFTAEDLVAAGVIDSDNQLDLQKVDRLIRHPPTQKELELRSLGKEVKLVEDLKK